MLQSQAVAQIDGEIGQEEEQAPPLEAESSQLDGQGGGEEHRRQGPGRRDGHRPRGDGPAPLHLVLPVGLHVPDIVEDIDGGGEQAEGREAQKGLEEHMEVEEIAVEGDRDEDEEILDIVLGPHQPDEVRGPQLGSSFHIS